MHATLWVSQYGHVDLARQCLQEMSRRAMRLSLDAHNAVLKALALQHKWSTATHVLLRMEQHELARRDELRRGAPLDARPSRLGRFGRRLLEEAEGASGAGAAAGSDGVGRGGILAAARGERRGGVGGGGGRRRAAGRVERRRRLRSAGGRPARGAAAAAGAARARGAGSSEESIHETGQTFVTLLKGLRHGGRWREAQQVVEIIGAGATASAPARAPRWRRRQRRCAARTTRLFCAIPARPAPPRPPPRADI